MSSEQTISQERIAEIRERNEQIMKSPFLDATGDDWFEFEIRDLLTALDAATAERDRLRTALAGLVGATDRSELEAMEAAVRMMSAPAEDKARSIDAIHALLATVGA